MIQLKTKSDKLRDIENQLYDMCYLAPRKVAKRNEKTSRSFAKGLASRHAHTAREILEYATNNNLTTLRILNASGCQTGHQDFSICHFLRQKNLQVEWVIFESPENRHLESPVFKKMIGELNITCHLSDFANDRSLYGNGLYDVVLFTEIAEHLEHSTFLRALTAIHNRIDENGILILTTPNLADVGNRFKLLLGNSDLGYWGDGKENMTPSLWGHITLYGLTRLRRLLGDAGLKIVKSYTISASSKIVNFKELLLLIMSNLVKDSKSTLFIVAKKSPRIPIPKPTKNEGLDDDTCL